MKLLSITLLLLLQLLYSFKMKLKVTKYNYKNVIINTSPYLQLINFELPTLDLCVGTPIQCFNVAVSNDFSHHYLPNADLPLKTPKAFNKNSSSTLVDQRGIVYTSYQNNFIKGEYYKDLFYFPNSNNLQLEMEFVLYDPPGYYIEDNFDGFFGFKKQKENDIENTIWNILEYMHNNKQIESPLIGVTYNKQGGYLYIGEEFNQGNYTKCNSSQFGSLWSCSMSSIQMMNYSYSFPFLVLFNSIYQVITGPKKQVVFIYDTIMKLYPDTCYIHNDLSQSLLVCDLNLDINRIPDIRFYLPTGKAFIIQAKNVFEKIIIDSKEKYISTIICNNIGQINWAIGVPGFMDNMLIFNNNDSTIGFYQIEQNSNHNNSLDNSKSSYAPIRSMYCLIMLLCSSGILLDLFNKTYSLK